MTDGDEARESVARAPAVRTSTREAADANDGSSTSRAVLVRESAFSADAAGQLDRALDGRDGARVLAILYREDVDSWMTAIRDRRERVSSAGFVAVGPTGGDAASEVSDAVCVVPDPTDLTGVGIAVSEWLDSCAPDERPVVCLDSLSAVLQYADTERTFRFLHTLNARFRAADARAFVSIDPSAHDESTVATLRTLFDDELRCESGHSLASTPSDASHRAGRQVVTDGGDPNGPRRGVNGGE